MHTSNKKKHSIITSEEVIDWYDDGPWWDWDCGPKCSCCARQPHLYEEFYQTIADIVADIIIKQQNLNADIRPFLVEERLEKYVSWRYNGTKINEQVREDIGFIWPHIKDTQFGRDLFAQIFGQRDD